MDTRIRTIYVPLEQNRALPQPQGHFSQHLVKANAIKAGVPNERELQKILLRTALDLTIDRYHI